jgi:hypothetical protein
MHIKSARLSLVLVIVATALSAWDGVFNLLSVLVFSGHEKALTWWSIYLPATLWAIALVAYKLPRAGLGVYLLTLLTAITFCVDPSAIMVRELSHGLRVHLMCEWRVSGACS